MHPTMYQLIGYELGTNNEVVNWPNVVPTRRFQKGDVIEDGSTKWEVVGVRDTSTESIWMVDVRTVISIDS